MSREEIYGIGLSILLSLYTNFLAIASGATPIGSVVTHPIERSRQKEGAESKLVIKNKLMDMRFRHNWLHLVRRNFGYIANKMNIDYSHWELFIKRITQKKLYIESVKQGCEI
jgi:hypothetical protein